MAKKPSGRSRFPGMGWARRLLASRGRTRRPSRRPVLENLEDRTVPANVLYLDFGDILPGGDLALTALQLRDTFGALPPGIQGPDLNGLGTPAMDDTTPLQITDFASLVTFDYNQDGAVDGADFTDLQNAVVDLLERYFAPFDLDIEIVDTSIAPQFLTADTDVKYLNAMRTVLQQGEADTWLFIGGITRTDTAESLGDDLGMFGLAPNVDSDTNLSNARDDTALVFADEIIAALTSDTQADTFLAFVAAQQAGRSFGLTFTDFTGGSADNMLLASSDLMAFNPQVGDPHFDNFGFFTRFDLAEVDDTGTLTGNMVNNYDRLVDAAFLGPRDNGDPDLEPAYVTGTGAFDIITITRVDEATANVGVRAFRNAAFSSFIEVLPTYQIDYTQGIVIEGGFSNDRLIIDGALGVVIDSQIPPAQIFFRGMAGSDEIVVDGTDTPRPNLNGMTYRPNETAPIGLDDNPSFGGEFFLIRPNPDDPDEPDVRFQLFIEEFEPAGSVTVQDFLGFEFVSPHGSDEMSITSPVANFNQLVGMTDTDLPGGGVEIIPFNFTRVTTMHLNIGEDDSDTHNDEVILEPPGMRAAGLRNFEVNLGNGDDTFIVNTANLALPLAAGGTFVYNGGAGTDFLDQDVNVDNRWEIDGNNLGVLNKRLKFNSVEEIETGSGEDRFEIFPGGRIAGLIDAGGGLDRIRVTGSSGGDSFAILPGEVTMNGLTTHYASIERIKFAGGDGKDTFLSQSSNLGGLQSVIFAGGDGKDTFNIAPAAGTPILVSGGSPKPNKKKGDTLNILFGESQVRSIRIPSRGSGTYKFFNRADFDFRSIERGVGTGGTKDIVPGPLG